VSRSQALGRPDAARGGPCACGRDSGRAARAGRRRGRRAGRRASPGDVPALLGGRLLGGEMECERAHCGEILGHAQVEPVPASHAGGRALEPRRSSLLCRHFPVAVGSSRVRKLADSGRQRRTGNQLGARCGPRDAPQSKLQTVRGPHSYSALGGNAPTAALDS
jgi:hypothetical protein